MKPSDLRANIPVLENIIYLDAASTTPTPKPVVDAMCNYYFNYNANTGRGAYKLAVKASERFKNARITISQFLGCNEEEIIFTKNTTEAINLVANGLNFQKGDSVIVPNIEHHSNFVPWLNLKKKGVNVKIIKANEFGVVNPADIEKKVDDTTKLITITHISNSIGSVQPIKQIGKIAYENNLLYLVDVAQSAGHMKLDLRKINADFIAFPGHKGLLGPVGTGFLYCQQDIVEDIVPINLGGGTISDVTEESFTLDSSPARFEGGTQNISGIIGLEAAVELVDKIGIDKIEKHGKKLTKIMFEEISDIKNTICYGDPENIYGITSFNINNMNSHDVAKILDENRNICVRSGYHCAIPAIRHFGAYELGGTVRASLHYYNTKEDIQILAEVVKNLSETFGD
ncbi:MAG: cysteine desulfurase [Methanobacteriaceae archaeon]